MKGRRSINNLAWECQTKFPNINRDNFPIPLCKKSVEYSFVYFSSFPQLSCMQIPCLPIGAIAH